MQNRAGCGQLYTIILQLLLPHDQDWKKNEIDFWETPCPIKKDYSLGNRFLFVAWRSNSHIFAPPWSRLKENEIDFWETPFPIKKDYSLGNKFLFVAWRSNSHIFQEYRRRSRESNATDASFTCPMCNEKTYRKLSDLNKHAKECGKRYNCDFENCTKNYRSAKALLLHVKSVHQKRPIVKKSTGCPECGAIFKGTSNLKRHIKNVHDVE